MITAKIKLGSKIVADAGDQVVLHFYANYTNEPDDPNKEWAKYTPALSLSMHVISEVAERFEVGKGYTLTFEADKVKSA